MENIIYLDTETTGLHPPNDELLEIAIVDYSGQPLIDTLVKPITRSAWPEAEAIHGISPDDVVSAPTLFDLTNDLIEICIGKTLVIYNSSYDLAFIPSTVIEKVEHVHCCMRRFAEHYGEWDDYWNNYKWQKLDIAAAHVRHIWTGKAHRALADALACKSVWEYLVQRTEKNKKHKYIGRCRECDRWIMDDEDYYDVNDGVLVCEFCI